MEKNIEKKENKTVETLQQFVTFIIGDETYGVEILTVQEIIGMIPITPIPNSLNFMKGVINLRGAVVPVVDMRLKFGMEEKQYTEFTVILIVEIKKKLVGMIVDAVSDVLGIPVHEIQDTPHYAAKIDIDYIKGIGKNGDDLIIILDVDKILTTEEFSKLQKDNVE